MSAPPLKRPAAPMTRFWNWKGEAVNWKPMALCLALLTLSACSTKGAVKPEALRIAPPTPISETIKARRTAFMRKLEADPDYSRAEKDSLAVTLHACAVDRNYQRGLPQALAASRR